MAEYQRQKRKVFKASYTNHYRRGLIRLLGVLEFRSNNTAHQPVIDALTLIVPYAHSSAQYYPLGEHVVLDGAVDPGWADLLTQTDSRGRTRIIRSVYEACVFQALRERLRCTEIWVVRAHEWRNPNEAFQPTSRPAGSSITRSSTSRWTPPHSPHSCATRCAPSSPRSTTRSPSSTGCGSPTARAARSNSRRWTPSPSRGTSDG